MHVFAAELTRSSKLLAGRADKQDNAIAGRWPEKEKSHTHNGGLAPTLGLATGFGWDPQHPLVLAAKHISNSAFGAILMCISFLQAKHPVAVWSGCHVLVEPGHVNTHPVHQHVELVAVGRFVATQKSYLGWLERLLQLM
jgi:hypothetical protein